MDTYQNPFESLADPEIERFSLYIRYRNAPTPESFAAAAGLTIAQALKWAAQPIIEACLQFHINRQFNLLTLDALSIRREAMHSTLELSNLLKEDRPHENMPETKEGEKRASARRHQVNSLLRAFSIMSRLIGSSLTTTFKNLQSPPTSPTTPKPPTSRTSKTIPTPPPAPSLDQPPAAKSAEEIAQSERSNPSDSSIPLSTPIKQSTTLPTNLPTRPDSTSSPTAAPHLSPDISPLPSAEDQTTTLQPSPTSPPSPINNNLQTEITSENQNLTSGNSPESTPPNPQENALQLPAPTENPFPYPLNSQRIFPGHPLIPIDNDVSFGPIKRFKK